MVVIGTQYIACAPIIAVSTAAISTAAILIVGRAASAASSSSSLAVHKSFLIPLRVHLGKFYFKIV
jgi:hypothetical protein